MKSFAFAFVFLSIVTYVCCFDYASSRSGSTIAGRYIGTLGGLSANLTLYCQSDNGVTGELHTEGYFCEQAPCTLKLYGTATNCSLPSAFSFSIATKSLCVSWSIVQYSDFFFQANWVQADSNVGTRRVVGHDYFSRED